MKPFLILISLTFISMTSSAQTDEALSSISQLRWQNRILLIFAEENQQEYLAQYKEEILDRDLIWFHFDQNQVQTNYPDKISPSFATTTAERYYKKQDALVLIGKDGGVKLRQENIDFNQVFALIDTMPMRIQEQQQ